MKIGYARVSTREQNLARQMSVLSQYKLDKIYHDKESGANFEREQYRIMKESLKKGDELYIKELDRLGRNKDQVKEELDYFKQKGVVVRILDIPSTLIDFGEQDWIGDMVTNILIEVLGSFAQQELAKNKARQREGIIQAKARGTRFGRPEVTIPQDIIDKVQQNQMSISTACEHLQISRQTWYNRINNQQNIH